MERVPCGITLNTEDEEKRKFNILNSIVDNSTSRGLTEGKRKVNVESWSKMALTRRILYPLTMAKDDDDVSIQKDLVSSQVNN